MAPAGDAAQQAVPGSQESTNSPVWGGTLSQDTSMMQDSQDEMDGEMETCSPDVAAVDLDAEGNGVRIDPMNRKTHHELCQNVTLRGIFKP